VGSALRALYPVNWEARPHACMFSTRFVGRILGGELIDRVLATIMELAIGNLVVSAIADVNLLHARTATAKLARVCLFPIALAQMASWVGGITDNKVYHLLEECLWAGSFTVLLGVATQTLWFILRHSPGAWGHRRLLSAICPLMLLYLLFLYTHDIPMYLRQWTVDTASGVEYNAFGEGLYALLQCDSVERSFGAWQEGLPWMTATFVPGPYIAILLLEASVRSEAAIRGKRPVRRPSVDIKAD